MAFKKGMTKTGGRKKGTPNKSKEPVKLYTRDQVLMVSGYSVGLTSVSLGVSAEVLKKNCIDFIDSLPYIKK